LNDNCVVDVEFECLNHIYIYIGMFGVCTKLMNYAMLLLICG